MNRTALNAIVRSHGRTAELPLLLDSGQMYTCLPRWTWELLGLTEQRRDVLHLSVGTSRAVAISECSVELEWGETTTPVILGAPGDAGILGILTLTELGLVLDPLSREIRPGVFPMHLVARAAS